MTNVTEKRKINELTLHELNIIYSLVRIGDWVDSEIGRVYKLSADDVRTVFDNYVDLLEAAEKTPPVQEQPREDPSQENVQKPRKRRCDSIYATAKERQSAYRARLLERRRTGKLSEDRLVAWASNIFNVRTSRTGTFGIGVAVWEELVQSIYDMKAVPGIDEQIRRLRIPTLWDSRRESNPDLLIRQSR